jgi:hypothetical protein
MIGSTQISQISDTFFKDVLRDRKVRGIGVTELVACGKWRASLGDSQRRKMVRAPENVRRTTPT